jgi:chemotaxis signal transduction protein
MELFAFQSGHEILGIPPLQVVRVVENIPIIPVPLTPPCHLGLIYQRGELYDVVDVNCLLYLGTAVARSHPRLILTKWSDRRLALVPDRILGLVWPKDDTRTAEPDNSAVQQAESAAPQKTPDSQKSPRQLSLDALWEALKS